MNKYINVDWILYSDDVMFITKTLNEGIAIIDKLEERLAEFELKMDKSKTQILRFGNIIYLILNYYS